MDGDRLITASICPDRVVTSKDLFFTLAFSNLPSMAEPFQGACHPTTYGVGGRELLPNLL